MSLLRGYIRSHAYIITENLENASLTCDKNRKVNPIWATDFGFRAADRPNLRHCDGAKRLKQSEFRLLRAKRRSQRRGWVVWAQRRDDERCTITNHVIAMERSDRSNLGLDCFAPKGARRDAAGWWGEQRRDDERCTITNHVVAMVRRD